MEARRPRRRAEADEDLPDLLENDWWLGSDEFRERILEQMETKLGENHSGELIRQSAEAKDERIIAEELHRAGWTQADLATRLKGAPAKMAMASHLRNETILPVT